MCRDVRGLHRVASFLQGSHALVSQLLCGVDYTAAELDAAYASITLASLLAPPVGESAALAYADNSAVRAAREVMDTFNMQMGLCQRKAKEAILDARIGAARQSSWNVDVAACSVRAAVSKVRPDSAARVHSCAPQHGPVAQQPRVRLQAFRAAYLFKELKELLHHWGPTIDDALTEDALPPAAVFAAADTAAAAFDITPGSAAAALRFRVPSAAFMLVWVASPHSPAHGLAAGVQSGGADTGALRLSLIHI